VTEPVAKPPSKPRRKLLLDLDFDDEHDVLPDTPAVGERKLVASEVTLDEANVSTVA
jgi:hypothetical protein